MFEKNLIQSFAVSSSDLTISFFYLLNLPDLLQLIYLRLKVL